MFAPTSLNKTLILHIELQFQDLPALYFNRPNDGAKATTT
jgi:hypothetical protein